MERCVEKTGRINQTFLYKKAGNDLLNLMAGGASGDIIAKLKSNLYINKLPINAKTA